MPKEEFNGDIVVHGTAEAANIGAKVYTVPTGTPLTGDEPEGSLWVEYVE